MQLLVATTTFGACSRYSLKRTRETLRERERERDADKSPVYMYVHIALYTDIIPPTATTATAPQNAQVAELNSKTCSFLAQNSLTASASSSWLRSFFCILINEFFFFTFFHFSMQNAVCSVSACVWSSLCVWVCPKFSRWNYMQSAVFDLFQENFGRIDDIKLDALLF